MKLRSIAPNAVHDHGEPARQGDNGFLPATAFGHIHRAPKNAEDLAFRFPAKPADACHPTLADALPLPCPSTGGSGLRRRPCPW